MRDIAQEVLAPRAPSPQHTQATFGFAAPHAPECRPLKPRTLVMLELTGALEDVLVELSDVCDDQRPLCRCHNQASCVHWASQIAREYRTTARSLVERCKRALKTAG